jgi:hypothetical protein
MYGPGGIPSQVRTAVMAAVMALVSMDLGTRSGRDSGG